MAVGLILLAVFVERQLVSVERAAQQSRVLEQLSLLQTRLEGQLNSNITLVRGLLSVVAAQPDLNQAQFERAAKPLFDSRSQLRNIGGAPDMVIRFMYPLRGNEAAVGLDYRKTPAQFEAAEHARRSGDIVLAGPFQLMQGGIALVARMPVYVEPHPGQRRFWGLISAVIDVERLYRDSGLLDENLSIEVALRSHNARGINGEVFFGRPELFDQEVLQRNVRLPHGSWIIAAQPRDGWVTGTPYRWTLRAGFLLVGLLLVGPLLLLGVNERRRLQAVSRLSRSEDWLSLAIAASNLLVWDWDLDSGALSSNPPLHLVLGLPERSIEPNVDGFKAQMHPEDIPRLEAAIEALLHDLTPQLETDFRLRDAAGEWRWFSVLGKVVARAVAGHPQRTAGVLQEVTVQKETLRQLEQSRTSAEAASQAKSDFLATMSHEIRTPMNGVLGMAELLMGTHLDAEQREFVQTLQSSGRSLLGIINDILDFSKIEAGKLTLESIEFDLGQLLGEVCALMRPRAQEKRLYLELDCPADLPGNLEGDAHRIRQVLVNLIGNALKFTQQGRIDIEISWRPQDDRQVLVRIAVRDTGIGIAPEAQKRLFTHFTQVDASTTRRFGGTGLGLAISKRLIDAMGGRIGCSSSLGEGACFWFELAMRQGVADNLTQLGVVRTDAETHPGGCFHGCVLVVEDNPVNLQVARQMLERLGLEVVSADNGRIGVEQFAARHVDLVLMDMQMPEMDGLEATRNIRALQVGSGDSTPIIALTANVQPEDRERCLAAGMNDFIPKPFCVDDLHRVLARWIGQKVDADEAAPPSPVQRSGETSSGVTAAATGLVVLEDGVLDELAQATGMSIAEISTMFFTDIERMVNELQSAFSTMPKDDLQRLAHTLKSSAGQMGGRELAAAAKAIEFAVREGKLAELPELIAACEKSYQRFCSALHQQKEQAQDANLTRV